MKRTLRLTALFLALILLALTLSSCASDPAQNFSNKYNPETDFQYALEYDSIGLSYITEAPDAFYILNEGFLYVLDKKTMEVLPLCKKPDCLHDKTSAQDIANGKISCEAYVGGNNLDSSLFYYDNAVYVATEKFNKTPGRPQAVLQKYSTDGTFLETVCILKGSPLAIIRHRGTVYYTYKDIEITDKGNINSVSKLMSVSLKDQTENELLTDQLYNPDLSFDKLFAFGKYVYLYDFGHIDASEEGNRDSLIEQLLIYDLETGESSVMEKQDIKANFSTPALSKDGLMYSFWYYDNNDERNKQVYKVGLDGKYLDGKNPEEFFRYAPSLCNFRWDGTYYYEDNRAVVYDGGEPERKIYVYNEAHELLDTITFGKVDNNPDNIDFTKTRSKVAVATEDYYFIKDEIGDTGASCLLAVDKKQIGTGNVVPFIVWKKGR